MRKKNERKSIKLKKKEISEPAPIKRRSSSSAFPVASSSRPKKRSKDDVQVASSNRPKKRTKDDVQVASSSRPKKRTKNDVQVASSSRPKKRSKDDVQVASSSRPKKRSKDDVQVNSSQKRKRRKKQKSEDEDDCSYTLLRSSKTIADWDDYLRDITAAAWVCPVDFFQNAPLSKEWKNFAVAKIGSKIELPHPRSIGETPVYSVATILMFAGYKALVRFENLEGIQHHFAWISYCSDIPKYLGYAITNDYAVLPVRVNESCTSDFWTSSDGLDHLKQFLEQIYTEENLSRSIDEDHDKLVKKHLLRYKRKSDFKLNDIIEVMDKEDPVQNRLAVVVAIIGDRIQVKYVNGSKNDQGFCFNVKSDLVHPLGWSHSVGQNLCLFSKNIVTFPTISKKMFPTIPSDTNIQPGMVFEVRHPFIPYMIATGAVKKKLKYGYFVAIIETNNPQEYAEFVFHVTSEYILPCGFSSRHNIYLEKPPGEDESFTWSVYMKEKQVMPLIKENTYTTRQHHFVQGCKFEAVDVFEPMYMGPATVLNVAGHLLYIHFDGWPRSNLNCHQWISAFSCDIYPAGWAELVKHRLQGHAEPPQWGDSLYIAGR